MGGQGWKFKHSITEWHKARLGVWLSDARGAGEFKCVGIVMAYS